MKSATTASTEIPQPAIAIPVCPVGTNLAEIPRALRLARELERDGHLPDRAVRPDRQHDVAGHLEVRSRRDFQIGRRAPQVAEGRPGGRREGRKLRVVLDELVQAVVDPDPVADAFAQELPPGRREPAADRRDTDERSVWREGHRGLDVAHDRHASLLLADPGRVEDDDDVVRAVAQHAVHRLGPVWIAREALGEDQQPSRSATRHRGLVPLTAPARRP